MLIPFLICFFASAVGAICGIGGGVVIKPLLELFLDLPITVIHFLSSSTVLCMSAYSVGSSVGKGDRKIDFAIGTPLAVGAACGGIVGKKLFSCFAESVSVLQSWLLIAAMLACLVYTIWQEKFPSFCVRSTIGCALAGYFFRILGHWWRSYQSYGTDAVLCYGFTKSISPQPLRDPLFTICKFYYHDFQRIAGSGSLDTGAYEHCGDIGRYCRTVYS